MKVSEPGIGAKLQISICDETGKAEYQVFDKIKQDNQLHWMESVNKVLNDLSKRNYKLVTATGGDYYTTYVFEKK